MNYIIDTIKQFPCLEVCKKDIERFVDILCDMHKSSGKLLICGNGGSAADCEHISGELLKGFLLERKVSESELPLESEILTKLQKGVPAIPLVSFSSFLTAYSNDVDGKMSFAQLVFALGRKEDVFLGISTSGNSENVVLAAKTARALGMKTLALTGENESELSRICDVTVKVPESETYKIQQLHLPVYHSVCAECERILFE